MKEPVLSRKGSHWSMRMRQLKNQRGLGHNRNESKAAFVQDSKARQLQHEEDRKLFSRKGSHWSIRMRHLTNPRGSGHNWNESEAAFVPDKIEGKARRLQHEEDPKLFSRKGSPWSIRMRHLTNPRGSGHNRNESKAASVQDKTQRKARRLQHEKNPNFRVRHKCG